MELFLKILFTLLYCRFLWPCSKYDWFYEITVRTVAMPR